MCADSGDLKPLIVPGEVKAGNSQFAAALLRRDSLSGAYRPNLNI